MPESNQAGPFVRAAALTAGAGLVARLLFRRSPANLFLAIVGTELLRLGATGHWLLHRTHTENTALDIVDIASDLSFPASDPPAY